MKKIVAVLMFMTVGASGPVFAEKGSSKVEKYLPESVTTPQKDELIRTDFGWVDGTQPHWYGRNPSHRRLESKAERYIGDLMQKGPQMGRTTAGTGGGTIMEHWE